MRKLIWRFIPKPQEVIIQLNAPELLLIQQGKIPARLNKKFLSDILDERPGFFIINTGISDKNELLQREVYGKICSVLGTLNKRYGEFYDVKDYGGDYRLSRIPVSQTHETTGFHTDSSALNYYPKYVGLLCVRPAKSGGESLLANGIDFLEYTRHSNPEYRSLLKIPVIRDIVTPGTEFSMKNLRANCFPVLSDEDNYPVFRYMRYWIERGHEKAEIPLSKNYTEVLDALDQFLNKPENQFIYPMKAGDILIFNNTFLLHNRTAYIDNSDVGKERLMVRTWIDG